MGCISKSLAARLHNSGSYFRQLTEQASEIGGSIRIPKDVKDIKACVEMGFDPVHAAYVSAQNLVSFIAESVSTFDEFEPYYEIVPRKRSTCPVGHP